MANLTLSIAVPVADVAELVEAMAALNSVVIDADLVRSAVRPALAAVPLGRADGGRGAAGRL